MLRYFRRGRSSNGDARRSAAFGDSKVDGRLPIVTLIKDSMKTPNVTQINIRHGRVLALHLVGSRNEAPTRPKAHESRLRE